MSDLVAPHPFFTIVPPIGKPGRKNQLSPNQVRGVENPATVPLVPAVLGEGMRWWSHEGTLLGGIQVSGEPIDEAGQSRLFFLPQPIPRSWSGREFCLMVEYEAGSPEAEFQFRLFYACGDISKLHLGETEMLTGEKQARERMQFQLDEKYIERNQLFRTTLDVIRKNSEPVVIYGAWLELRIG